MKDERGTKFMKKTYKIEVDCANCANLMESEAKKTDGVANAVVNFMTQKMIVEHACDGPHNRYHHGVHEERAESLQKGRARLRN